MKKIIKKLLPDTIFIFLQYLKEKGEVLKFRNPTTFSEKIQWIKLHGNLEKYAKYVDKYHVREYVAKTIGNKHLVPLLGIWENPEDISFSQLPDKFVLKATHGSGYVSICKNKKQIDIVKLKNTAKEWLHKNFYDEGRESQYRYLKPKIIAEKYLEEKSEDLRDYKIFCYGGVAKFINLHLDRFSRHKSNMYDINWNKLPISLKYPNSNANIPKPKKLSELIRIAEKLSKKFPFVRVDLYILKDKVYFGELTLTPGNGMDKFNPKEADYTFGKLIDLSKYKNNNFKSLGLSKWLRLIQNIADTFKQFVVAG